jgi:adenylate kinase
MTNRPPTIALMGPPGCGKGTQSRILAERLGLVHISSGDIIRENIRMGTQIGKAFEEAVGKGELGPTHLVTAMMRDRLAALAADETPYILDGFPRTMGQAEMLTGLDMPDAVVYISVGTDQVVRRVSGRLSCPCGAVYHKTDAPPKKPGACDRCGQALFSRPDDEEPKVRIRMGEYARETLPLLDYYRNRGKLIEVDGTGILDRVTICIVDALGLQFPDRFSPSAPL